MNTVDDNICAKILRGFDITPDVFVKKFQMGAVGLIDNEDFARIVNHLGDGFDVTADAIIVWAGQNHCAAVRMRRQAATYFVSGDLTRNPIVGNYLWISVHRLRACHGNGVENRLMAVPRKDQFAALWYASQNCSNQSRTAAVDEQIAFPCLI